MVSALPSCPHITVPTVFTVLDATFISTLPSDVLVSTGVWRLREEFEARKKSLRERSTHKTNAPKQLSSSGKVRLGEGLVRASKKINIAYLKCGSTTLSLKNGEICNSCACNLSYCAGVYWY